jgi:hypothetical protein
MTLPRSVSPSVIVAAATLATIVGFASPLAAQASKVVVWVRPASDDEMRLLPSSSPTLRRLARSGVSLPGLSRVDATEVVRALRELGKSLPKRQFRELGVATKNPEKDALSALRRRFGKAPPASKKDAEAVERLREAGGGKGGSVEVDGDSAASATKPRSSPLTKDVMDALDDGVRLVLKVESRRPTDATEQRQLDDQLTSLGETIGAFDGLEPVALVIVLLPESGRPALLIAGRGVKRARVSRQRPDSDDLAAGIARLVRASATKGDPTWLLTILENDARTKLNNAAKERSR